MSECFHDNKRYCYQLDTTYCYDCLSWLEVKCPDEEYCEFCWKRPDKPSCDRSECGRYCCKVGE